MKKVLFIFIFLFLIACQASPTLDNYNQEVIYFLNNQDDLKTNVKAKYFEYYLPADMQKIKSDESSVILSFNNNSLLLNLNLNNILNVDSSLNAETGFYDDSYKIYNYDGSYDTNGETKPFNITIYQENNESLICFSSKEIRFYSFADIRMSDDILRHMLIIVKSFNLNKDAVLADFSKKAIIDYQKKQIDLFDIIVPKNGYLSDMIVDKSDSN